MGWQQKGDVNLSAGALTVLIVVGLLAGLAWLYDATRPRGPQCLAWHLEANERGHVVQVCDHWGPEYLE